MTLARLLLILDVIKTCVQSVLLLILLSGMAVADSASTSMDIRIVIPPIKMLGVSGDWDVVGSVPAAGGGTLVSATGSYGVTCVPHDTTIWAQLEQSLPPGARVSVLMHSSVGVGLGWTELSSTYSASLVFNPKGAEFNTVEMRIAVPVGMDVSDLPIEIVYWID